VIVEPCVQRLVVIVARVHLLPDYLWEVVRPSIEATLRSVFGFAQRDFEQAVEADEVLATIQRVRGVDHAILDRLGFVSVRPGGAPLTPDEIADALSQPGIADVDAPGTVRPQTGYRPAALAYLSASVPATLLLTQIER
jgi:hypothetical protein